MAKRKTLLRTIAVLLLALVSTAVLASAEVKQYLLVTENSGTETSFALSESPVITLDGGMLTVESASQTLSVAIADVADYKFVTKEDIPTAVDKLEAKAVLSLTEGKASVTGLAPGASVGVYTADGVCVVSAKAGTDGSVTVDLRALGNGRVYILRTPSVTYKVFNK